LPSLKSTVLVFGRLCGIIKATPIWTTVSNVNPYYYDNH
jgi:hypothetical protein